VKSRLPSHSSWNWRLGVLPQFRIGTNHVGNSCLYPGSFSSRPRCLVLLLPTYGHLLYDEMFSRTKIPHITAEFWG
jgi:hypothetical protein